MAQKNILIEQTINKLKAILLKEEGEYGTWADRAKSGANAYGDKLGVSSKIEGNDKVIQILKKGDGAGISASFINDMNTRYDKSSGKSIRTSDDTPKFITFDYIVQMLLHVYHTPVNQSVQIGEQQIVVTPKMKTNIYNGLLGMFNLKDPKGVMKNILFGSGKYSLVQSKFRPRLPRTSTGAIDHQAIDDKLNDLNFELAKGLMKNIINSPNSLDKGSAYILVSLRNTLINLFNNQNRKASGDGDIFGMKNHMAGKVDPGVDLSTFGGKDRGDDPMHTSQTRYVDAMKDAIDTSLGSQAPDSYKQEVASKANEEIYQQMVQKMPPHLADLYKAIAIDGIRMNAVASPENATAYPAAYEFFKDKPEQVGGYFQGMFKGNQKFHVILKNVMKKYVDDLDRQMTDFQPKWKMAKTTDAPTGKPTGLRKSDELDNDPSYVDVGDPDQFYANMKEAFEIDGKLNNLVANILSAFSELAINA